MSTDSTTNTSSQLDPMQEEDLKRQQTARKLISKRQKLQLATGAVGTASINRQTRNEDEAIRRDTIMHHNIFARMAAADPLGIFKEGESGTDEKNTDIIDGSQTMQTDDDGIIIADDITYNVYTPGSGDGAAQPPSQKDEPVPLSTAASIAGGAIKAGSKIAPWMVALPTAAALGLGALQAWNMLTDDDPPPQPAVQQLEDTDTINTLRFAEPRTKLQD